MELLDLQDFKKIIDVDPPMCSCIIPAKYKNEDAFDDKMDLLENKAQELTQKPFINSGHAFICFDSVSSVNIILKHFRRNQGSAIKIFFQGICDKLENCFRRCTGRYDASGHMRIDRDRTKSNFLMQSEDL